MNKEEKGRILQSIFFNITHIYIIAFHNLWSEEFWRRMGKKRQPRRLGKGAPRVAVALIVTHISHVCTYISV